MRALRASRDGEGDEYQEREMQTKNRERREKGREVENQTLKETNLEN